MAKARVAGKQRQNSDKPKKRKPPKTAFKPGNPYRWQPGESGNPNGAPKGPKLSDLIRQALDQKMPADKTQALKDLIDSGATIGQIIAMAVGLRAADGDLEALSVIADRTEGAPEQTVRNVDLTADDMARARERAQKFEQERFGVAPSATAEITNG